MNKRKNLRIVSSQSGVGLVEVIAALGISIIVITSMVSLAVFTLRSSLQSKLLLQGTKLANEELERVRAYRDTRAWTDFVTDLSSCTGNAKCSINNSLVLATSDDVINLGTLEELHRYFRVSDQIDGDGTIEATDTVLRISVVTTWTIAGQTKSTYVYTDLSSWRNQ